MGANLEGINMPTKLTIIGNGFDLALGAKTSYGDFYSCLKDSFQAKSVSDFKNSYIFSDNEQLIDSFYTIVDKNRDNYFINYFLNYKTIFGNWVSFEQELTKIVQSLDDLVLCFNSHNKLILDTTGGSHIYTYVKIMDKTDLLKVLSVYPDNKYFNFGMDIDYFTKDGGVPFDIKGKVFKTIYEAYEGLSIFAEVFPKLLYKDLIVFSNLFSLYLGIVNHFARFDSIIRDAFESSFFINYNFTRYLEELMKSNDLNIEKVLYINGVAENINGIPKESIVFGIDSDTKLQNSSFEVFTKRIQRSIKDTQIKYLNYVLKNNIEEIYIIGHSLNIADYESLSFIFSKCENPLKPKITIYYYDEESKIDLIINLKLILGNDKFDLYQREGMINFLDSKRAWIKSVQSKPKF